MADPVPDPHPSDTAHSITYWLGLGLVVLGGLQTVLTDIMGYFPQAKWIGVAVMVIGAAIKMAGLVGLRQGKEQEHEVRMVPLDTAAAVAKLAAQ